MVIIGGFSIVLTKISKQSTGVMRWRLLFWPLGVLYDGATRFRNHLFNIGHKPSFRFDVPVISVGNLNAGGSGKTPMIEYLIRLLSPAHRLVTLSRGYGRITRGIRFASDKDSASTIGDEPFQFFRKFGPSVAVVVGEDRALAIPTLLNELDDVGVILLDDAFQHRSIRPQLSILLTEYHDLFTRDFVLPAGNLRESRWGAGRADVIVITKCPDSIPDEVNVVAAVKHYAGEKPVFFSTIRYGSAVAMGCVSVLEKDVVLVTGIANSAPLRSYLQQEHNLIRHFRFRDHHRYTSKEVKEFVDFAGRHGASLVTTEKDMVRLVGRQTAGLLEKTGWFYIPIEAAFLKNGAEFDELVRRSLNAPIFVS
jgi:tetraacyldisaccharide 4'-kinase